MGLAFCDIARAFRNYGRLRRLGLSHILMGLNPRMERRFYRLPKLNPARVETTSCRIPLLAMRT
jgi:hypothetical protein